MKFVLTWLFFIPMGLSMAYTEGKTLETLHPKSGEEATPRSSTTPIKQDHTFSGPKDAPPPSTTVQQRDEAPPATKTYAAWVTDQDNVAQVNETRTWLEGLVKDKSEMERSEWKTFTWDKAPHEELQKLWDEGRYDDEIGNYEKVGGWHRLILDDAGYDEVSKKKEWIKAMEDFHKYTTDALSPLPEAAHKTTRTLETRKFEWGDWIKEENAARDLVQASRYEGSNFDAMEDYVCEKRAGSGVAVYVIDYGVQVDVEDENLDRVFPKIDDRDREAIVETNEFYRSRLDKRRDYDPNGHGTMVASKIVGQWGTAKDATLIPVQVDAGNYLDMPQGFAQVYRNLLRRQRRDPELRAVVVMSRGHGVDLPDGSKSGTTRDEAERSILGQEYIRWMTKIFDEGVPIVLASGNWGEQAQRDVIDLIPQVLEKEDFPIINVGATTLEGKAWPKTQGQGSQDGTQLTIYAVGENVLTHNHIDGKEIVESGTSLAAPVVAGIIAVHFNYKPWDQSKTGMDRVKEIKRWLRTPESSWERVKNSNPNNPNMEVNMIWTGADEAAHKQVEGAASNAPTSQGRTLVVGMEQVALPRCITYAPVGVNQLPATICNATPDYSNRYFFYRLDHVDEVPSLCTSQLGDFYGDNQGATFDEKLFEKPGWPKGEWNLKLFGEQYTYKNDGKTAGALWKGGQKIDCNGDLTHHDPKSDEWCEHTLTRQDGINRKRRRILACKW